MKNENLEKGKKGEDLAWEYLAGQGYRLLERNLHWGHLELDLVVENDDFIVFVEVKTRKNNLFGEPESFVTLQKQRNMIRAANGYVQKNGIRKDSGKTWITTEHDKMKYYTHSLRSEYLGHALFSGTKEECEKYLERREKIKMMARELSQYFAIGVPDFDFTEEVYSLYKEIKEEDEE